MALMMVAQGLTPEDVVDPDRDIAFPGSVVEMLKGDLGQPIGGWPTAIQSKVLKGETPITVRPASLLGDADLEVTRAEAATLIGRPLGDRDLASFLMYPKVFTDFAVAAQEGGPVSALPTAVFFGGMKPGEEIVVEIDPGKTLIVRLQAISEPELDGQVKLFFELNGQPRVIRVADQSRAVLTTRRKAEAGNDRHIPAPMAGAVSSIAVRLGQKITAGEPLLTLEAMKMETTLNAPRAGVVAEICVEARASVEAKDLLIVLE